jgi:hypothetical protein
MTTERPKPMCPHSCPNCLFLETTKDDTGTPTDLYICPDHQDSQEDCLVFQNVYHQYHVPAQEVLGLDESTLLPHVNRAAHLYKLWIVVKNSTIKTTR